jgi:hypothetical protein
VSYHCQLVHKYPKRTISRPSPRQSHDEIHSNLFLLPLRYLRGLQHPSGSLMLIGLDFLIGITKGNILGNISLNSVPPVGCLEIMVHPIPSWMNGISRLVSLTKYLILQFFVIKHIDPSFVPQYSLIIFQKSGWLLFLGIALYLLDLLAFHLTFPNILE